jgi:hypothetical protein
LVSLTPREERRLRLFEERVLMRIFGPKRFEVTGEWRKLHEKELYDLYCTPNIIRVIKYRITKSAGHVARMKERRGAYRVLVWKSGEKTPLGIFMRRLEDNINLHFEDVG